MTSASIVVLVDIQNGFACEQLTPEQGGSLYVPGGEKVGRPAAALIRAASDTVFVLSQDFHPAAHISFASTHGVAPFSTLRLRRDQHGRQVVDSEGPLEQTAWLDHCRQGTPSALFVDDILQVLPPTLQTALQRDVDSAVLSAQDARNNVFYVIRKGMRRDLDSYGIATENDRQSTTRAPAVFEDIAAALQRRGVKNAVVAIGGLATNFCVEFSHQDLYTFLLPALAARRISAQVLLLTDISAGIDMQTPDGSWPDHATAGARMARMGTRACASADLLRQFAAQAHQSVPGN